MHRGSKSQSIERSVKEICKGQQKRVAQRDAQTETQRQRQRERLSQFLMGE